jgi:hypothetical protein
METAMTREPVNSSLRLKLVTTALGIATVVAACGGGGSGDTPTAAVTPAAAVSYAQGVISGFGSVIVGGVRYDDSKASVVDALDNPLPMAMLGLGTMVTVDAGNVDRSSNTAVATRFHLADEVLGPVSSVDTAAQTMVVLGQSVAVNAGTVFDSRITGGLSQALVGTVVEVHGTAATAAANAAGPITATRIETAAGATSYHLRGTVSALDTTAKTFAIGAATVSYAGLAAADVPATLANGVVVRARLNTVQSGGNWVATALRGDKRGPAGTGTGATDTHIEGAITVFTSSAAFEIGGVKVDASAANFPDGSSGIVLGARVEVTGTTNASGTLVATRVELDDKPGAGGKRPLELHGALGALDTTAKTFLLRTVTVSYGGTVTYKNGSVADLINGKNVDVYGVLSSDRKKLEASRIEFK